MPDRSLKLERSQGEKKHEMATSEIGYKQHERWDDMKHSQSECCSRAAAAMATAAVPTMAATARGCTRCVLACVSVVYNTALERH